MKSCQVCGAQNLDDDDKCGICGHNLSTPKPARPSTWKKVLLHYMTAPYVAAIGIIWFWFVDGLTGLLFLLFSAGLLMASIGPGPREEVASWRNLSMRAYRKGFSIGWKEAEKATGEKEGQETEAQAGD